MSEKPDIEAGLSQTANLRSRAEARLHTGEAHSTEILGEADALALIHELQVHQIELEMQNEELLHAQAPAAVASEKYGNLFDFAPVGYFVWDAEARIVEVNLAGAALLGLDRNSVIQKRFGEFVAMDDRVAFLDYCRRVQTSGVKQTCKVKLLGAGQPVHVLIEGIAARDRPGQGKLCRAAVIDITLQERAGELAKANQELQAEIDARKRAEGDLKAAKVSAEQAKAAAEQANRAKDHFLAVLSHELRTPLTPVVMGLSMLQDRRDLDPAIRETLEMVRRNVQLEARLIDDLLDVSRIARGKIELTRSAVELCTVIHRAIEVCKPDMEERGLHLGVDLGAAGPYWVEADVSRLQQVFWNLLKNATKFTPKGGCVGIRCQPSEKHVVVEVCDSGMGIEPEVLPRIFNAFEQAGRSITQQFGGLGLGLAISRALVELHGGEIEACSEGRGKGATFRVRLPLAAAPRQLEAGEPAVPRACALHPVRILLVEDHPVTAELMRIVLTAAGHAVETAGDVATALKLAGQHAFDLLLSDLGLPDGSGYDLIRQLRQRGHKFPAIALSGYGQGEDVQRSREAGFVAHLTKPASRKAVIEAVASVTAGPVS